MPEPGNRVSFMDYLPSEFRDIKDEHGVNFLQLFLKSFERFFEGIQKEIEGMSDGTGGGIPSLFYPGTGIADYFQFYNGYDLFSDEDKEAAKNKFMMEHLAYIAGWIGLPLREDNGYEWNYNFLNNVISKTGTSDANTMRRGTLKGIEALLKEWLNGEELGVAYLDDCIKKRTSYEYLDLGYDEQFTFSVHLVQSKAEVSSNIPKYKDLKKKIKYLLDLEKPAHTRYKITFENAGFRVAPDSVTEQNDLMNYAQIKPAEAKQYLILTKEWYDDTEF